MSTKAPRGSRLNIAVLGRRNVGKSALINRIVGEEVSIVSDVPGTTTDTVAKAYELLPLGPVTFHDTAGLDDIGKLGGLRSRAARKTFLKADLALLVTDAAGIGESESEYLNELKNLDIPIVFVFNKTDLRLPLPKDLKLLSQMNVKAVLTSLENDTGIDELKEFIIQEGERALGADKKLLEGILGPKDIALLIVPIDSSAPKGRLILPQVQAIREGLDLGASMLVCRETELSEALNALSNLPDIVITDSQVIGMVNDIVPKEVPLTTFSILFARAKGDLQIFHQGSEVIDVLQDGNKVLIAEACSHHAQEDDIGRVKIPALLRRYSKADLIFDFCTGNDFPENMSTYKLMIHCGACMIGRRQMLRRINECLRAGLPITNYGMVLSKINGSLSRTLSPFS